MAQTRFDMLYSDHNRFIAEGFSVAKGQVYSRGSASDTFTFILHYLPLLSE